MSKEKGIDGVALWKKFSEAIPVGTKIEVVLNGATMLIAECIKQGGEINRKSAYKLILDSIQEYVEVFDKDDRKCVN